MLTIGQAAQHAGLTSDTIRYYERLRLVKRAPRSGSGYRLYDDRAVDRLRLVRRARLLGFSLDEIRLLFRQTSGAQCATVRDLLERKIAELDRRISTTIAFRDELQAYRCRCDRALQRHARRCPLFTDNDN